ncbi:MAG TPA: hypothetical protein VGD69_27670 [Herpetosiphonaceae bacterium]
MAQCRTPGTYLDTYEERAQVANLVERIIQKDYCGFLLKSTGVPCSPFLFASVGGTRTEFFDEDAGQHRCAQLADYLKFHNGHVDHSAVVSTCLQSHPKPLLVKVPDIISHRFTGMEFYEIKPNSNSGLRGALEKVVWFNMLCSANVANLMYVPGSQYKPNLLLPWVDTNLLGASWSLVLHIFWKFDGVLLYEFCPTSTRPDEKCTALLRGAVLAQVTRWRFGESAGSAMLEGLIPLAFSPLQNSVGAAFADGTPAANQEQDVRYVQLLLNDWRGRAGLPLIDEDGLIGGDTRGAIRAVQETFMVPDERVDPGQGTIALLESQHLRAVFEAGRIVDPELAPDQADPAEIAFFADHDEDVEGEDEATMPDGFAQPYTLDQVAAAAQLEIANYFQLLYA